MYTKELKNVKKPNKKNKWDPVCHVLVVIPGNAKSKRDRES